MKKFEPDQTRLASRSRKRKQNRLLNILITIVVVLIFVVGYNIIFGGTEEANPASSAESKNNEGASGAGQSVPDGPDGSPDENDGPSFQENDSPGMNDEPSEPARNDHPSASDEKDAENESDPLEGPWEPIGTEQEEPHVSSYERGSVDWNEKVEAILYATGLNDDEMTLKWLGNDGGPQKAVGKVIPKNDPDKMYIVHLQWVKNKGWKPTNVEKVDH